MLLRSRSLEAPAEVERRAAAVSLDEAYRRYLPYVAKLGYRLLGGGADVDDLVQDVFVAAAERLPHLRDPDALKSFLASITVRTARRKHVRRRLRNLLFPADDHAAAQLLITPSAEGSIEARGALGVVFRALERAPIEARLAWTLRNLEDEPLEAVARLCGCSLATAKRRITAAQRLLEKELEHD